MFIILLPLKNLFHCLSLKKLLKQLEKMIKKLRGDTILENLENWQVQLSKLV